MRRLVQGIAGFLAVAVALWAGVVGYTLAMARLAPGTPPAMAAADLRADLVTVDKSAREMVLWRKGQPIRRYEVSLGAAGDGGPKAAEGDEKTPEGRFVIDWRNPRSIAHLSLHISYPRPEDSAAAQAAGHSPGGNIMIHGLPNGWGWLGRLHLARDWTDGCIAVTDAEMQEIWSLVADGTRIDIQP